ncbi:hypothetical protein NUACC26_064700 [Scytonema sp. NUACC26]
MGVLIKLESFFGAGLLYNIEYISKQTLFLTKILLALLILQSVTPTSFSVE